MRILSICGIAVAGGGILTFLINSGLTPFLQSDAPFPETAGSALFLWRQSLSALAAVLLLFGSIGLYLQQAETAGRFGAIAFLLAFIGSALLLAHEWSQIFFVRELAFSAPEVLQSLESEEKLNLFNISALAALSTFVLGWILFSISMLKTSVYSRRGPILLIVGFFATPMLAAALPDMWGLIIGNAVLGSGWFLLGSELYSSNRYKGV